jgi:phosphoglycolate phosphatase-like HAD superfamily hydrolase
MRALEAALTKVFGLTGSLADIEYAGRTDRWILRQVFAKFNLPASEENFARYFEGYAEALPGELARGGSRVLPGVLALIEEAAHRPDISQGLLTGNLRRGAEAKLGRFDLWRYFPFGAFADDSEDRAQLGPHALARATLHHGVAGFPPERVWVIGDTPHDIACGRAIGARTLAVATGNFTVDDLKAHQPTAVLADLSDPEEFWRIVCA